MLQRSSTTTRLLGGFACVIALMVAVAALGLVNLRSQNESVDALANNRVPQVIVAGRWEAALLQASRHMQAVFLLTEQGEIQAELKALEKEREAQAQFSTQMQSLVTTPRGRQLLEKVGVARSDYVEAETEFLRYVRAERLDEAKTTLLVRVRPAQESYIGGLQQLGRAVTDEARGMAMDSAADFRTTIVASAVAAIVCVAAAILIAGMLSRALRRQLGGEPAYAASVLKQVAGGDLTVEVRIDEGDRDSLLAALRQMVTNLRAMVAEATRGAQAVADTSAQIAQGNLDLSQRTEEQATTLQDTASSMEDLTTTVGRNAQNAREASKLAASAADTARQGNQVVDEVVNTMDHILDASRRIADIIGVIDGIAFQTNILALNAAVEAARAGDQGRGFAVVAAEVRSLAHRSAAAAKEIKTLIGDASQKVQAGATKVDAAGHTMVGVVLSVEKVNQLIAEIAAASQEQSARIAQVSASAVQMDHVVQQNASLVEEASAATESMKEQAAALLAMVSRFRLPQAGGAEAEPAELVPVSPAGRGAMADSGQLASAYLADVSRATHRLTQDTAA